MAAPRHGGRINNRYGLNLGGRGQYYGVNEIDDFINSFMGVQNIFSNATKNQLAEEQLAAARMAGPLQGMQIQQQMQGAGVQNQLYDALLSGQISPEEYAAGIDAFGIAPSQMAQGYSQRQQNAFNQQLAKQKFASQLALQQAKYDLLANKMRASGGGSGEGSKGKKEKDFSVSPAFVSLLKHIEETNPDMPKAQAYDMARVMAEGQNGYRLSQQGQQMQAQKQELAGLMAEQARRKNSPQKAPSAAPNASSSAPLSPQQTLQNRAEGLARGLQGLGERYFQNKPVPNLPEEDPNTPYYMP